MSTDKALDAQTEAVLDKLTSLGVYVKTRDGAVVALDKTVPEGSTVVFAPLRSPTAFDDQPRASFDDPRVQTVYDLVASNEEPPEGEHWDGWVARRIVDALGKSIALTFDAAMPPEVLKWLSAHPPTGVMPLAPKREPRVYTVASPLQMRELLQRLNEAGDAANDLHITFMNPVPTSDTWTGCGDCDVAFPCHGGEQRCIRLPLPEPEPKPEPKPEPEPEPQKQSPLNFEGMWA